MHTTLTKKGWMKVHFYNPNLVIFQNKPLNDVEINTFFHFQVHTTIIKIFLEPLKIWALKKNHFTYRNGLYEFKILNLQFFEK
jgi:hypothetical protein